MVKLRNKIKILSAIAENKVFGKKTPLRVVLKITKRCNLRCKHCLEYKFQEKELSLAKAKQMLKKVADAGAVHLSINGGEPLIRDDIGEIISYAKKLGMGVGITSNGFFVPQKINQLKDIDVLGLSLDGPKHIHDYLRGKGQFEQVIKAIKVAKENNIKNIYINTVLTKEICQKLEYIDEMINIAKKNKIRCNFVTMYGDVREGSVIEKPNENELKGALIKIVKAKRQGEPIIYSQLTYDYILNWPDFSKEKYYQGEKHNIRNPIKCLSGELSIAIEANGDVFPCNMVKGEMKPINIFKWPGSFSDLMKELGNRNKCRYCYYGCYCEGSALFGLKPKIIREYLKKGI